MRERFRWAAQRDTCASIRSKWKRLERYHSRQREDAFEHIRVPIHTEPLHLSYRNTVGTDGGLCLQVFLQVAADAVDVLLRWLNKVDHGGVLMAVGAR